ncbi:hypothetical protein ACEUZ9_000758 [Paracoccus litorisediminis]|uniref:hypothetical protein n=1 Tax=Paracoccus litorisediminis TaxID=2006130 RepID=UPI00373189EF
MLVILAILAPTAISLAWTAFKILAILNFAKRIALRLAVISAVGSTGVTGWYLASDVPKPAMVERIMPLMDSEYPDAQENAAMKAD